MIRLMLLVLLQICLFEAYTQGTSTQTRTAQFNLAKDRVAIQGYDPVTYFLKGKAVKGKDDLSFEYEGIVYRFSSAANLELFKKQPGHYEPQYGGWCAYAMGSNGEKVEVDPETFKIINGKLYLFYNSFFNNTMKSWNKDEPSLNKKADTNWTRFYHQ